MNSTTALKWICGVGAGVFVGYAIYFDYCRTRGSDYKEKIRESELSHCYRMFCLAERKRAAGARADINMQLPDMGDRAEVQQYFLQQVQLGEELISQGTYWLVGWVVFDNLGIIDEGVQHLCNAIVLCGQPDQLLAIFQQTMPMQYPKILEELPRAQAVRSTFGLYQFWFQRIEAQMREKFGIHPGMDSTGETQFRGDTTIVDDDDLE